MNNNWHSFWENYRNIDAKSEEDLFVQVGKTISQQPIKREIFEEMIAKIIQDLELDSTDYILDMCCGNGLISYELAALVEQVVGVDFAEHLIEAAEKFKSKENIIYKKGDVTQPIEHLIRKARNTRYKAKNPNKYLMNDALAYFNPKSLSEIIDNICVVCSKDQFRFLLTGIPNDRLKWNFYNTTARKQKHLENVNQGDTTNDGLGRWWDPSEIENLCIERNLKIKIRNQPEVLSNYRMDALIWKSK